MFNFPEGYDNIKAIDYFAKGINDGILRHGWRKDYIVSDLFTGALEILIRNEWLDEEELKIIPKEVLRLAIRVRNITDGKGTQHGPYTLVERVAPYNTEVAESLYEELKKVIGSSNETTAIIIKAKISKGLSIDDITEELESLKYDYDRSGYGFDLEKFKIFLAIAANSFYTKEERRIYFEKAYNQIEIIQKQQDSYGNLYNDLRDEFDLFRNLCGRYNQPFPITKPMGDKYERHEYNPNNEMEFIKELLAVKSKNELKKLYTRLYTYDSHIELQNRKSWEQLVNRTMEIDGNLSSFVSLMKKNNFPHLDYFTHNAKYLHFGLAAAIGNINSRKEIFNYLATNSGHGGFYNTMKAYEVLRDKEMSVQIFNRFFQFCKLLVD